MIQWFKCKLGKHKMFLKQIALRDRYADPFLRCVYCGKTEKV